jgi:hypothetical protein
MLLASGKRLIFSTQQFFKSLQQKEALLPIVGQHKQSCSFKNRQDFKLISLFQEALLCNSSKYFFKTYTVQSFKAASVL